MKRIASVISGICLIINLSAEQPQTINASGVQDQTSVSFIENKGQVSDQAHRPRPDVLYSASDGHMVFHIKSGGISYQLGRIDTWKDRGLSGTEGDLKQKTPGQMTVYRVDMNWPGANPFPEIFTDEALYGYDNYYLDHCPGGILNVKSYKGITLNNVYNNINLHYYQKQGRLKYDYIVAPYANYRQIQLEIRGAKPSLQKDGSLLLETPLGNIVEEKPLVYQNGIELAARWVVKNNILSFEIDNYKPRYELVIDPVTRLWGSYYGGGSAIAGFGCSADASGNVYMSGTAILSLGTGIATSGAHQTTHAGSNTNDGYLAKFNSSGVRQWGTYYGGSGYENGRSCCTDPSGNVYLAGATITGSGNAIATSGAHQPASMGGVDAYLVKFNSSGVRLWGTYYGGSGDEDGFFCSTDVSGNVYLAGITSSNTASSTAVATSGAYQTTYGGGMHDAFIVKFDGNGVRQWGTYYGGAGTDFGRSCSADASGNVYLAGYVGTGTGTVLVTSGAHQTTYGGGNNDAFIVKFNSTGVRQWCTYYGGDDLDYGFSCTTDAAGNIYFAGTTSSSGSLMATSGAYQITPNGPFDAFLVKFNSGGTRQWGTYYGGSGTNYGISHFTDAVGNTYLTGFSGYSSPNTISTSGSHQTAHAALNDAYIAKFNSNGALQWGSYYGGSGDEQGNGCTADQAGNVYVIGTTNTNTGTAIATAGSHQSAMIGSSTSAFIAKFLDCNMGLTASANTPLCAGGTLSFTSSVTNTWPLTYSWTGPASFASSVTNPVISNAASFHEGAYILTVNNGSLCSESATVNVTVNPIPVISVNSGTVCAGQPFAMVSSGAATYTFSSGSPVVFPTINSTYFVSGTSSVGCVSSASAISSVSVHPLPVIAVNSGTICAGQSFTIIPSGAVTYNFSSGAVVSPPVSTNYTVTGTDAAGCTSSPGVVSAVTVYSLPVISVNSGIICAGESFTIIPSGAVSYSFSSGSAVVVPTANIVYTVTGTSAMGCHSSSPALSSVTVNPLPLVMVNSGSVCAGQSFTMIPSGGASYTISGGSQVVTPSVSTSYTVYGTSSEGCVSSSGAISTISVMPLPVVTIAASSSSICAGSQATLVASGASTYTWSNVPAGMENYPVIIASPPVIATYVLSAANIFGCEASAGFVLTVNPLPVVTITTTAGLLCAGESVTLTANGADSYTWNTGSNAQAITVAPPVTTNYTVTGSDLNGCSGSHMIAQVVDPCTGIARSLKENTPCHIYPNPSTGKLFITIGGSGYVAFVEMYNTIGQVILIREINPGISEIDLELFATGIYMIRIKINDMIIRHEKIIRE